MTIKDMVAGKPALEQLRIFCVADRHLPGGRYYAGQLAPELQKVLEDEK